MSYVQIAPNQNLDTDLVVFLYKNDDGQTWASLHPPSGSEVVRYPLDEALTRATIWQQRFVADGWNLVIVDEENLWRPNRYGMLVRRSTD